MTILASTRPHLSLAPSAPRARAPAPGFRPVSVGPLPSCLGREGRFARSREPYTLVAG